MHRGLFWGMVLGSALAVTSLATAETTIPDVVRSAFVLPAIDTLQQRQITSGLTLTQQNWQLAEQVLPVEVLRLLQAGDFTITVQATTDMPVRESYVTATAANLQTVALNGGYKIDHYQGGRPFPVIDPNNPRAGEQVAWNFRYRDMPVTMEMRGTMQGVNNSGTIDRSNVGRMRVRYGMDRVGQETNDAQWQAQGIRIKALFESIAPSDQEGFMRITTMYDDEKVPYDDLSYSPQNRRTRKGYVNLMSRMGGGRYDVLSEEQPPFFFIGYLHEYNWAYKGEQTMLMPGFFHGDQLTFGGKNNWYPATPWELRHVIVLESTPKGAHPYSKRTFYLDAQTYTPLCVLSYDPQGAFVRLALMVHAHPDFVPGANGVRIPVPLGATWVNFVQEQASQMVTAHHTLSQDLSPRRFELMELLRKGK
ncbi:MAG: DUF1329 domain-containing protein [Deltaproteobacteria bacterium]|nr:DUF1329 domain-containing protein [Deltaproteobacteria bacterium]